MSSRNAIVSFFESFLLATALVTVLCFVGLTAFLFIGMVSQDTVGLALVWAIVFALTAMLSAFSTQCSSIGACLPPIFFGLAIVVLTIAIFYFRNRTLFSRTRPRE